jgi:hypothetical protein
LEAGKWSRLDSVCVVEGFYCICVGPCCHQEITCINVDKWVLLV